MKSITKDLCIVIQSRLSSERLPAKMLKPLGDTNLFQLAIRKVKESGIPMEDFYVSVYEPELIEVALGEQVNIFERTKESATAESEVGTMFEWYNKLPYKHVMMINPCLPFLKPETIKKFYDTFKISGVVSMFAVTKKKNYYWNADYELVTPWPDGQELLNTKAVEHTYEAAHALYGSPMDLIGEGKFMGDHEGNWKRGNPILMPIEEEEAFDIDYPWQFELARGKYEL